MIKSNGACHDRIVIVGGGMAGSLLALVLGRKGLRVTLVDPHREPPSTFRNEKLGIDQIARLEALGVLSCFEEACWAGKLDEVALPLKDCGARYDRWVSGVRAALPSSVAFVEGKGDRIETSGDRQNVFLTDGSFIDCRLTVLATGPGERLRAGLGIRRTTFSEKHSLCLGFSLAPPKCRCIEAAVFPGRFGDSLSYVTVFPMPGEIRVNVFSYRDASHPWVRAMRADPVGALTDVMPQIGPLLRGLEVARPLEVRATDLYATCGHVRDGVVLLGDAYHAPCPASGTGMTRILNDVDRLANLYIPRWLSTPGMGRSKVAAFYADPIKRRVDRKSVGSSLRGRAMATSRHPYWRARRALVGLRRTLPPHVVASTAS